jgi:hypothetical protein
VSLLQTLGYDHLRIYPGGMADWVANGQPVTTAPALPRAQMRPTARAKPNRNVVTLIDSLAGKSVGQIMAFWLAMVLFFACLYWAADLLLPDPLLSGGTPVDASWKGFLTAVYFSFVTATSVGYGDVVPSGLLRVLAVGEAVFGLLTFGFVISKFLSRRQESLVEEIHHIAYEDRLGRVQTNLHLVLSEVQAIAESCVAGKSAAPRTRLRAESAAMVFLQELRTICANSRIWQRAWRGQRPRPCPEHSTRARRRSRGWRQKSAASVFLANTLRSSESGWTRSRLRLEHSCNCGGFVFL